MQSNGGGGAVHVGMGVNTVTVSGSTGTVTYHEPFTAGTHTVVTGVRQNAGGTNHFVTIFNQATTGFDYELEDSAGASPNLTSNIETMFFTAFGETA